MSKSISVVWWQFSTRAFKTASYMSRGTFWGKQSFPRKKIKLFCLLCSMSKKSSPSGGAFSIGLPKTGFYVSSAGVVIFAFNASRGTFWQKYFFEKRHFIFLTLSEKDSDFFLFIGEVVGTAFCISRGTLWARENSFIFSVVDQKCSSLVAQKLRQIRRKCIVLVQKNFSEELFWKKNKNFVQRAKSFGVWEKLFRQDCQNCIPQFQQRNLMKFKTKKEQFFTIFAHWAKIFLILGKSFKPELSKLSYMWPDGYSEEKRYRFEKF